MPAKSGGFAVSADRGEVTRCSQCDAENPDSGNRGYCSNCGALFRDKIKKQLTLVQAAVVSGAVLTLVGAALTLALGWKWTGVAIFAVGIVPLAAGIFMNRQLAGLLVEAMALRRASETVRSLRTTDRVAVAILLYFLIALAGCIPYYFYVEQPQQLLGDYQARFAGKIAEYAALVPEEALPALHVKPYLTGKAIALDQTDHGAQVSEVHLALPPEVRAEKPDQVGTVVLIRWKDFKKGEYGAPGSGVLAYRVDGDVRIINVATKSLLAQEIFQGSDPPHEAAVGGGPIRGPKPIVKVVGYVAGLPTQEPPAEKPAAAEKSTPAEKPTAATANPPDRPAASAEPKASGQESKSQPKPQTESKSKK